MNKRNFTRLLILLIVGLAGGYKVLAQSDPLPDDSKWSKFHGNEWIVKDQKYARIAIKGKGIYQVDFASLIPLGFPTPTNLDHLQLWHRGKQVALLSVDNSKIVFYGEPNDGLYDDLLTRPDPSIPLITSRMNKYVSLFSDEGVYYLTQGTENGLRAVVVNSADIDNISNVAPAYHIKKDTTALTVNFTHTTQNSTFPRYMNSYFDYWETLTGARLSYTTISTNPFKLNNLNNSDLASNPIKAKVFVSSRCLVTIRVDVKIGPKGGALRTVGTIELNQYRGEEFEFVVNPSDLDANNEGSLVFSLNTPGTDHRFSVTNFTFTYPQNFNVGTKDLYIFNLMPTADNSPSKISLTGLPTITTQTILDITNPQIPILINTAGQSSFSTPRVANEEAKILFASKIKSPVAAQLSLYTGQSTDYTDYSDKDFIIITTNEDAMVTAAESYAAYRGTTINKLTGDLFKPVVLKIKDIYNQYNYGEPSAVAIRRCLDFMLKDKNFNKFLFLVGNSTTYNNQNLTKELVNQVPTVGYPGSDFLLVSGLAGTSTDFQTIPFGRLPVGASSKIDDYLAKVKEYEDFNNSAGTSWRKNVIHVSGGKTTNEVNSFRNELVARSTANIAASPFNGETFSYAKSAAVPCPANHDNYTDCQTAADLDIANKVNAGAGVLTYYGHGNVRVTDYFFGYVNDPAFNYTSTGRYTAMFLYGCDVNNVFTGVNENVGYAWTNTTRRAFTLDWLLTPKRGAITVVANSWEGYEQTLTPFLRNEYSKLFVSDASRPAIGSMMKSTSNEMMGVSTNSDPNYNYNFMQSNIHQTILLGDPTIVLAQVSDPLPVEWLSVNGKVSHPGEITIEWKTASEKNNSHFIVERSADAKVFEAIGTMDGKGTYDRVSSYKFIDSAPNAGANYYRLAQVDIASDFGPEKSSHSRIIMVDNKIEQNLFVSPNPSLNVFEINSKIISGMAFSSWDLLDLKGRLIIKDSKANSVDLSNHASGTYILNILTVDGKHHSMKLVKQ